MKRIALDDPRYYHNRHVQWLEFNRRVLEEARDLGNPLLERVKFLAITANNLDEFVEVRVSSFLQRIEHGSREVGPDGLTAEQELEKVSAAMHVFVEDQYKCWNEELLPALSKQSIHVLGMHELDSKASIATRKFYERRISPMLTPVTVDPSHPFPRVLNKALCIAFLLRRRREAKASLTSAWSPCLGLFRACSVCRRKKTASGTFFFRTLFRRMRRSSTAATRFSLRLPFESRATAICISRKKRRAA